MIGYWLELNLLIGKLLCSVEMNRDDSVSGREILGEDLLLLTISLSL